MRNVPLAAEQLRRQDAAARRADTAEKAAEKTGNLLAVLRRSGRRVIARRLSPELQRTVGVVYKQKTGLSTAGQMFLGELKASIPNVRG